jgi:hypothetical protein
MVSNTNHNAYANAPTKVMIVSSTRLTAIE